MPVQTTLQQQPQGSQSSVVRWERLLPLKSLKILLVENDDSTRHVVSALLRNCSYEVTAVANGLEAWSILEDLTNHIDLILAEMDMPYLSGIALLLKVMNHKTCKNIPVIMMSSDDSMGIVFKSLSKGAVDFLVKPIRKNELKNLWQHVWRRCQSSSGSGSESGIRTQKSIKPTGNKASENDTDRTDEDVNGSFELNARDGSDNGSGIQSSWPKRVEELGSPRLMSAWDQRAHPHDSTCALVIHSRLDAPHDNQGLGTATGERKKVDDKLDLKPEASRNLDLQLRGLSHKCVDTLAGTRNKEDFDLEFNDVKKLEKGNVDLNDDSPEMKRDAADDDTTSLTRQLKLSCSDSPSHSSQVNNKEGIVAYDANEGLFLQLGLKQLKDGSDTGASVQGSNFLKRSGPSAFSRYNNSKVANQAPTGNVGSCSPVDDNSGAAKAESMQNFMSTSSGTPNRHSNASSNNDMGSTTNNVSTKPGAIGDGSTVKSKINIDHGSSFQSVQHDDNSSLQPVSAPGKNQIQVQHHHHHYHHHHHHVHNSKQQQQLDHDGNAANYGSASGSNNGSGQNLSSEPNGSSNMTMNDYTNATTDGEAAKCPASSSGIGSGSGLNQSQIAHREAALNKFRQKRKERCYDKKICTGCIH
ncbi:hypothetical protein Leryth_010975 [Lithospermum erythrorhizon]|nr:hypothetical protein Leryth_010975 [Lithospermum erythrorhizon]